MPGRGGRSKACFNCKRRKIGCDSATPSCGRCVRLGERCKGYAALSFVMYDSSTTETRPAPSETNLTHLDLTAMHPDIFVQFTRRYLLPGAEIYLPILDLLDYSPSNPQYRASSMALSTAYFGIINKRPDVLRRGLQLYGRQIQTTGRLLTRSSEASADLMASILCLGMFEFIRPSNSNGWMAHALGMARLFERWGPHACADPALHKTFSSSRMLIISALLHAGERSFLAETRWKIIPWQDPRNCRNPVDFLLDVMADLPDYNHRQLSIDNGSWPAHSPERAALQRKQIADAGMSIQRLDTWWLTFGLPLSYQRREVPSVTLNNTGYKMCWTTSFAYDNLTTASALCRHDGTRIFLHGILAHNVSLECKLTHLEEMRASALNICRSADYHFLPEQVSTGAMLLMFPIGMALKALQRLDMKPELQWAWEKIAKIGTINSGTWKLSQVQDEKEKTDPVWKFLAGQ